MKKIEASKNLQLVQSIFNHTKNYRFYVNSFNMVHPIIKAVGDSLPAVFDYLNCRIQTSNHIPDPLQYDIKDEYLE